MAGNSENHKDAKQKRKTIKVEIPVPAVPHVPKTQISSVLRKSARSIRKGGSVLKKKLSVDESQLKRPWNLPKHHGHRDSGRKGKHMHQVMTLREVAAGSVLVAAVILAIVLTRPAGVVVPQDSGDSTPFWDNAPEFRETVSFEQFMREYILYSDKTVALHGFLRSTLVDAPGAGMVTYRYYIVDDFGNEISLIEMGTLQKSLFPKNGTTEDIYNVTGVVKTRYGGFDVKVLSVEKA